MSSQAFQTHICRILRAGNCPHFHDFWVGLGRTLWISGRWARRRGDDLFPARTELPALRERSHTETPATRFRGPRLRSRGAARRRPDVCLGRNAPPACRSAARTSARCSPESLCPRAVGGTGARIEVSVLTQHNVHFRADVRPGGGWVWIEWNPAKTRPECLPPRRTSSA